MQILRRWLFWKFSLLTIGNSRGYHVWSNQYSSSISLDLSTRSWEQRGQGKSQSNFCCNSFHQEQSLLYWLSINVLTSPIRQGTNYVRSAHTVSGELAAMQPRTSQQRSREIHTFTEARVLEFSAISVLSHAWQRTPHFASAVKCYNVHPLVIDVVQALELVVCPVCNLTYE